MDNCVIVACSIHLRYLLMKGADVFSAQVCIRSILEVQKTFKHFPQISRIFYCPFWYLIKWLIFQFIMKLIFGSPTEWNYEGEH